MWTVNELIVLSDLHLTPERNTGPFQLDRELAECLHWVLMETQDCMIVLAGDLFDFLSLNDCPSTSSFDRLICHTKQMIENHSEVFDALARLAQSPQHTLVFMTGEGDAELMIPQVQETIEGRLGLTTPNRSVRWLVLGETLRVQVGSAVTMIEHGNAFDPWNRLDHASLLTVLSPANRNLPAPRKYQHPLGLELNSRVLNYMRSRYQWIDCLRPANESILPLLWPLASQSQQTFMLELAGRYESMKTEAALKELSNSYDPATLYRGDKEVCYSSEDLIFKDWIDAIYARQEGAQASSNLTEKIRLISNHDRLFEVEEPNYTLKHLQPVFDSGVDLIIHGHTHAAKICAVDNGLYINTGTWGQFIKLPRSHESNSTWEEFLERLKTNTVSRVVRPTFAHVYQQRDSWPIGALIEWNSAGPETLAARHLKTHALTTE